MLLALHLGDSAAHPPARLSGAGAPSAMNGLQKKIADKSGEALVAFTLAGVSVIRAGAGANGEPPRLAGVHPPSGKAWQAFETHVAKPDKKAKRVVAR
jgi:hypothetical protein